MGLDDNAAELNCQVDAFFGYLSRLGKAPGTVARWRPELALFVEWAAGRGVSEVSGRDLALDYLNWWHDRFEARRGRAPSLNSVRAATQAVKSFFDFCERFDYLVDAEGRYLPNPAKALQLPTIPVRGELDWLPAEDDARLLSVAMNERERIQVFFLRMTGLRLTEALTLLNRDVDLDARTVQVRVSKTPSGYRSVPITNELCGHILAWRAFAATLGAHGPDAPFLVTRNGTRLTPQQVETTIERVARRAGLSRRVTPHTLRRTFGSDLLNKGVRLEVISRLLGHSSTAVTERCYARLQDATIRDEMLKALIA